MKLKVLSWNIWVTGLFDQITDFIKSAEADIIGLQEVQADDPQREIIKYLDGLGYQHVFAPVEKTWGSRVWNDGPAIFSKHDIVSSEIFILSEEKKRAAVRADIKAGDKTLHIFNTHLFHTHQQPSAEQDQQGANLIKVLSSENVIVMGDLNAAPNSNVVRSLKGILIDSDSASLPTWSVYPEGCKVCNPQEVSIRLDYIFTSADIKTSSFKVEDSKASDHLPISVILEV